MTEQASHKPKRQPRGRRAAAASVVASNDVQSESKEVVLYSGKTAVFELIKLTLEELVEKSFVDESINGREQSNLTDDTLAPVSNTITDMQFYPCYVVKHEDGRYEFIDGSRRKAAAIKAEVGLECLVTKDGMTTADKIHLAQQLQTAREHNCREEGFKIIAFIEAEGITQAEAAKVFDKSEATISRHIKAGNVSNDLLCVFPERGAIGLKDYVTLYSAEQKLQKQQLPLAAFLDDITEDVGKIKSQSLPLADETKALVVLIDDQAAQKKQPLKKPVEEFPLAHYTNINRYAKVITQGDKTQFVFKGISPALTKEIEDLIRDRMAKENS